MNLEQIDLKIILSNWEFYKDKDLTDILLKDINNKNVNITSEDIKNFMFNYSDLADVIIEKSDIYKFINDIKNMSSNDLKQDYIKKFVDNIIKNNDFYTNYTKYKQIIKYSSVFLDKEKMKNIKKEFDMNFLGFADICKNQNYFLYLDDERLKKCFEDSHLQMFSIIVYDGKKEKYVDFYDFIKDKADFESIKNFVIQELEILPFISANIVMKNIRIYKDYSLEEIQNVIQNFFKKDLYYNSKLYSKFNLKEIIKKYKEKHPSLFISDDAPENLKKAFYLNFLSFDDLLKNPDYMLYLNDEDIEKYIKEGLNSYSVNIKGSKIGIECLYNFLSSKADFNTIKNFIMKYSRLLESSDAFDSIDLFSFTVFNENTTFKDIKELLSEISIKKILESGEIYFDIIPEEIKEKYSYLFLPEEAPEDLKEAFYNKNLTLEDLINNPKILKYFDNTNISSGLVPELSWTALLYNDIENIKEANYKRIQVMNEYLKIKDYRISELFKKYLLYYSPNIELDKIDITIKILKRLCLSNSDEFNKLDEYMVSKILKTNNPLETFDKIEKVFLENALPDVGKIYFCFDALYPDFKNCFHKYPFYPDLKNNDFEFYCNSSILKSVSDKHKKLIIFSDLIKATFGSNNRSVNKYLKNIEFGSNIYEKIKDNKFDFNSLKEKEKEELIVFNTRLASLYNSSLKANLNNEIFKSSGKIEDDIIELARKLSPDGNLNYNLGDRIIRMFCGSIGINSLEEVKNYIDKKIKFTDLKNREASKVDMELNKGDFVKGIFDINFLKNILQNGVVSKEFLASDATIDITPLDTDVSIVEKEEGTLSEKSDNLVAFKYGPVMFVFKNDDRFIVTKDQNDKNLEVKKDLSKFEAFHIGFDLETHFGIRTGLASSEIDYILMKDYDDRVGLEIAMNGFYIPVANMEGRIVFTPNDYDNLRKKMSGLTYYTDEKYNFSQNLINEDIEKIVSKIEENNLKNNNRCEKLKSILKDVFVGEGLKIKEYMDGDLKEGFVELIDTGSTSRKTNSYGDYDYDFFIKLDKKIFNDKEKMKNIKYKILNKFNIDVSSDLIITANEDFRIKNVKIDDFNSIKVDINFDERGNGINYSSDMALKDRLEEIKNLDSEKYKYVLANILLAKQILKESGVYKPNRSKKESEGGLGGIGVENWILQNGGSFIDASKSFLEAAENKNFEEFKDNYKIWDFGENHISNKISIYKHDEFIDNNMTEEGFEKMVKALKKYVKTVDNIPNEKERK